MTTTAQLIAAEATARKNADAALDKRLDAIEALLAGAVPTPPITPTPPPVTPTNGVPLSSAPTPNSQPPALGQSITEALPGGGSVKVTAISKALHAYATIEPWSRTGKWLLLGNSPGSAELRNGTPPYALVKVLAVPSYAIWSPTEEDCLYGVPRVANGQPGGQLVKFNVVTGATTLIHDFGTQASIGNFEGGISDDGRLVAIQSGATMFVWDVIDNKPLSSMPLGSVDKFQVSRKGNYVVVVGSDTSVYDIDLTRKRLAWSSTNHGDNALLDGEEVFVSCNVGRTVNGQLTSTGAEAIRLSDLKITTLVPFRNAFQDGHASGRGPKPVLSCYNPSNLPGNDQLVAANANKTVDEFGWSHVRTVTGYSGEPHAVPSRDGRLVLFAGWGGIGAFIAERLP